METLKGLEVVRSAAAAAVLRDANETADGLGLLEVRFSVFDVWYPISSFWEGDFVESVSRGAFTKTIKENRDRIRSQFDHGMDSAIGDKFLGTIEDLREDPDAGVAEVALFDTSYNRDLLPGLRAGVYGASMRMRVIKEQWNDAPEPSDYNPKGLPERTITEAQLAEVGPVSFGANPSASTAMRSGTDDYLERLSRRDPKRVEELRSALTILRTPPQEAAGPTTAEPQGAATSTTHDEPASSHSGGLTPAQRRERLYPNLKGARA